MNAPTGDVWGKDGSVDHNIAKVVSGIAPTALIPATAAEEVVHLLGTMFGPKRCSAQEFEPAVAVVDLRRHLPFRKTRAVAG
jgi:hypothetical protein